MSLVKNILFKLLIITIFSFNFAFAEDLQKVAKFKDWEVVMVLDESNKETVDETRNKSSGGCFKANQRLCRR